MTKLNDNSQAAKPLGLPLNDGLGVVADACVVGADEVTSAFFSRLLDDGLAAVKVYDASVSGGQYRLSLIFGSQRSGPRECCVDIACGDGVSAVAAALRQFADHICEGT